MKKFIEKNYDYLFGALVLLMPFGNAFPNIITALLIVCFLFSYKPANHGRIKELPYLLLNAFLLYIFIKAAITQSLFTEWGVYEKLILLFILPVLLQPVKQLKIVKAAAVLGVMASIFISLFLIGRFYVHFGMLPFTMGADVNKLMLLERPYMGIYTVLGAILSYDLIKHYTKQKKWLIASGIVSVLYIILISARISFITLILLAGVYIFFYLRISILKKAVLTGLCFLIVALTFTLNKNIADRFFIKKNLEQAILASDYEPRLIIWPCAYTIAQNNDFNVLFGYPDTTIISNRLVDCYTSAIVNNESKKAYFIESRFNSHNQFIDIYLSTGFIGLILFFSFLTALFFKVRHNFFDVAMLMAMLLFLLVENVFHRQTGCYIFSIFTALLLMRKTKIND